MPPPVCLCSLGINIVLESQMCAVTNHIKITQLKGMPICVINQMILCSKVLLFRTESTGGSEPFAIHGEMVWHLHMNKICHTRIHLIKTVTEWVKQPHTMIWFKDNHQVYPIIFGWFDAVM
jgi:hypothetical protein